MTKTGDPFIDAVYDGIPMIPVDPPQEVHIPRQRRSVGSLASETFPVWGTFLLVGLIVFPVAGYILWKESREG